MSFLNRYLPGQPRDDALQSVLRNLRHLMNSRRKYGSLLCSFGLADYLGEHGGQPMLDALLREIFDTISIYEPRLQVLNLRVVGRDEKLRLHVDLRGILLRPFGGSPCRLRILFHSMTGAAQVEVFDGP